MARVSAASYLVLRAKREQHLRQFNVLVGIN
jgi:hypothetical protein